MKITERDKGQIAAWDTLNGWFCTLTPAYNIDKIRVDFVKKGTNAKNSFSIYVDMDRFDILCDDILSMRFKEKLNQDNKHDYPEAWRYVTGEDGSKELRIGFGRKNICIQGSDKKKEGCFGVVGIPSYDDLRIMAKDFRRTSAQAYAEKTRKCLEAAEGHRNSGSDNEPLY